MQGGNSLHYSLTPLVMKKLIFVILLSLVVLAAYSQTQIHEVNLATYSGDTLFTHTSGRSDQSFSVQLVCRDVVGTSADFSVYKSNDNGLNDSTTFNIVGTPFTFTTDTAYYYSKSYDAAVRTGYRLVNNGLSSGRCYIFINETKY